MIEFLNSWAKGLGVTIVVVSILEMLLPNNKTKKYIRMVLGVFVIFNIISPFIQNKEVFNMENFDFENYETMETTSSVNQTSMDARIQELYEEELEKDIKKKLKEQGYEITTIKVVVDITKEDEEQISKIKLKAKKIETEQTEQEKQTEEIENKIVTEIQKIKEIDTSIKKENKEEQKQETENISKADIQNIKKILIDEYGVNEKCLEIN